MQANASLTTNQEHLISALLQGSAVVDAASACKINESTAHRWLKLPHVQEAYKTAQKQMFDRSLTGLMTGLNEAISGIKDIAKDSETPAGVRLRAYQIWLEAAVSIYRSEELEARLRTLEEQQGLR